MLAVPYVMHGYFLYFHRMAGHAVTIMIFIKHQTSFTQTEQPQQHRKIPYNQTSCTS
jgi:hypothetical protein